MFPVIICLVQLMSIEHLGFRVRGCKVKNCPQDSDFRISFCNYLLSNYCLPVSVVVGVEDLVGKRMDMTCDFIKLTV